MGKNAKETTVNENFCLWGWQTKLRNDWRDSVSQWLKETPPHPVRVIVISGGKMQPSSLQPSLWAQRTEKALLKDSLGLCSSQTQNMKRISLLPYLPLTPPDYSSVVSDFIMLPLRNFLAKYCKHLNFSRKWLCSVMNAVYDSAKANSSYVWLLRRHQMCWKGFSFRGGEKWA